MFKNQLAHRETFTENFGQYDIDTSYSVYEVFIELSRDKDGNVMKNKNGSDRYHAIDDSRITKVEQDIVVRQIREGFYKIVYQVNGDYVEKVERDGKRMYFVVKEEEIVTLAAGTQVIANKDTYRIPNEVGYVLINDVDIENPKIVAVRKFETEDHKAEAEQIVRNVRKPRPQQD